jgi:CRISPR-associated protein Csm3
VVFGGIDDQGSPRPAELVYSIYHGGDCQADKDIKRLKTVFEGLQLLEDDYLGGLGSRGSGKVRLHNIRIELRDCKEALAAAQPVGEPVYPDLSAATQDLTRLEQALLEALK